MGKYCIPTVQALEDSIVAQFQQNFYNKYDIDQYTEYITDLIKAWKVQAIAVGVAFGASMLYLLVLRCFAGPLIWISILTILGAFGAGGYWAYFSRNNYDPSSNNYKYLMYGGYTLWGIDGLLLIIVMCCCGRIRLAVAIMKVTSSFIYRTPQILILPIFFLILCAGWVLGWTFLAVYIMSVGQIGPRAAPFQFATTVIWDS